LPKPSDLAEGASLVLLTREDCGLCEAFAEELAAFAQECPLPRVELCDVDSNPALARRYGLDVPVLLWGDVKIAAHRLDKEELKRLLRPR
jgi:thiol-disulfide isomerase/thioredoxin